MWALLAAFFGFAHSENRYALFIGVALFLGARGLGWFGDFLSWSELGLLPALLLLCTGLGRLAQSVRSD